MSDNGTAALEHTHQAEGQHRRPSTPVLDLELAAMQTITTALDELRDDQRARVLTWVNGRWPDGSSSMPAHRGRK